MHLKFQIEYRTYYGQRVLLTGSHRVLGEGKTDQAVCMNLEDPEAGIWTYSIDIETTEIFTYRYFIKEDGKSGILEERDPDRVIHPADFRCKSKLQVDYWRSPADPEYALFSSAFQNAVFRQETHFAPANQAMRKDNNHVILRFRPDVIRLKKGHRVSVCGNIKPLGGWDDENALELANPKHPRWEGEIAVKPEDFPVYYKYLIKNEEGDTLFWEKCAERVIYLPGEFLPDVIEISNEKFDYPRYPWKGAGVAVPVFSLRRRTGYGVGEFTDLKMLVDWAKITGLQMIQILPVNDTVATHSWQDSYPYAAISVFALHPIYINLNRIGNLNSDITGRIVEEQGKFLNSLDKIDYEAVMALKSRFFKLIFDQQKESFLSDPSFLIFFGANKFWLKPYAAFSYLRDLFNTADFKRWGKFSQPTPEILDQLTRENSLHFDDIAVHYFIQYHAYQQLQEASLYARKNGIVLKGDIPIGIYRNSVDAWLYPHLFNMDSQAGAPPDDFSDIGQNWRFPTYNWDQMAQDNYQWWRLRLQQMVNFFDAFRIDHILGFFRIWEIPSSQAEGLMGYFNPSLPYSPEELAGRGLLFDYDRFCKPFIRTYFLPEIFGEFTDWVIKNCLTETSPGCYELKPAFNTQRKVEARFSPGPDSDATERNRLQKIAKGLFSLISEVIFLEAPGTVGKGFFPRNALFGTYSYRALDSNSQQLLNEIHTDYFYRRNEDFWREKALLKLPVVKNATQMLLCGEDLGMVPACVPRVMSDLGILSLEVQRMPKNPLAEFGKTDSYPYLSVASPSSHDTSTIRGWWKENRARTQKFYNEVLGNQGEAPEDCDPRVVEQIVLQHLYSPSMWAVFPIQDLAGLSESLRRGDSGAERINIPSNPNHYWRYRFHVNLDDLIENEEFNQKIWSLTEITGRTETY